MKKKVLTMAVLTVLFAALPVFAVNTAMVLKSGPLVILFLAFCAAIVFVQLIPALVLLTSALIAVFRKSKGIVAAK